MEWNYFHKEGACTLTMSACFSIPAALDLIGAGMSAKTVKYGAFSETISSRENLNDDWEMHLIGKNH